MPIYDEPGEKITVETYTDIATTTRRVTAHQRQLIKELLNDGIGEGKCVIWLPEFITKPEMNPVKQCEQLFIVDVEDYSDDAWRLNQDESKYASWFVPKRWVVVFEPSFEGCIGNESSQVNTDIETIQESIFNF